MAVLAVRNLRRSHAMGLPSGQGAAHALGLRPLTTEQPKSGLPPEEVALPESDGGLPAARTPPTYHVLREAEVLREGN